ncbi:MAG: tetratricopeptide repeat protein [Luteimonas sp.]|nr:tetratricopeptide repeat protein [Luteimonas sp.]
MAVLFHALILLGTLAVAALVAAPLRKASPKLFAGILVALPVLLFALYRLVGAPVMLDRAAVAAASAEQGPQSLDEAIAQLQAELQRDPAQPEGWRLLGRSYATLGRHAESRDAFMTALRHAPDDAELLVEAAQAVAQADPQHRFDDAALAMLRKALAIDPANQRAQWFLGVAQRQRGEDADAVATWEALLPKLDADTAAALRAQVDEARRAAGMPPSSAAPAPAVAASGPGLRVRVSLDPDFAARVRLRGDAIVFVIARAPDGPPMPVAVERHALQDLPLDLVLDDGDSAMPTAKLSALQEVEVFARISASGSASRGEGDIESAPVRVKLPAEGHVELVLGKATP